MIGMLQGLLYADLCFFKPGLIGLNTRFKCPLLAFAVFKVFFNTRNLVLLLMKLNVFLIVQGRP